MEEYLIETRGLTKQYGSQTAVQDLDLQLRPGHIYGLLGRNGAGKTTTMKMLLALAAQWPGSGTAALVAFFWGALGGLLSNRSLFLHLNPLSAGTALWRWEAGRGLFFDASRLGLSLSGLAVAAALGVLAVAAARDRASARHRGKRRRHGRP